jgi:hypothetical protein
LVNEFEGKAVKIGQTGLLFFQSLRQESGHHQDGYVDGSSVLISSECDRATEKIVQVATAKLVVHGGGSGNDVEKIVHGKRMREVDILCGYTHVDLHPCGVDEHGSAGEGVTLFRGEVERPVLTDDPFEDFDG